MARRLENKYQDNKYQINNSANKNNVSNSVATGVSKPNINNLGKPPVAIMYPDKNTSVSTTPTPTKPLKPVNNQNNNSNNSSQNNNSYSQEMQKYYQEYLDKLNEQYQNTVDTINTNRVNAKNEIAIAEQNTAKYIDNYLKSQGLYGSGMGGSLALGNINQANSLRNATDQSASNNLLEAQNTYDTAVNDFNESYNTSQLEQAISNIDSMIANGSTKEDIENYLNRYMSDTNLNSGTKTYLEDYLNNISGATSWTEGRDTTVNELAQVISQITDNTQRKELQTIAQKLYNAKTQEEYTSALNEYEKYVNSQLTGGSSVEETIGVQAPSAPQTTNKFTVNSNNSNNVQAFYSAIKAPSMVGGLWNGSQKAYVSKLLSNANNNKLNNNIVIDINHGGGNYYVFYSNGSFYALGSSIPSQYANLPTYDENNINEALTS